MTAFTSRQIRELSAERRQNLTDAIAALRVAARRMTRADIAGDAATRDSMRDGVETYQRDIQYLRILTADLDALALDTEIEEISAEIERRKPLEDASAENVKQLKQEVVKFGSGSVEHVQRMRDAANAHAKLVAESQALYNRRDDLRVKARACNDEEAQA